ncbi:MAG: DMT family transporter [Patescibacteria group bacterium]|nr:DMT family transporter [Patescibacteria group bacterium]
MSQYASILLVILIAFLGGGISPFTKLALNELSTPLFIALRFIIAGLLIIPLFLYKKEKISKEALKKTLLVSLLAVSNVTFFALGIKRSNATVAQIMYAGVPIIVALILRFLYKQPLAKKKIVGIVIGFLAVLFIILAPIITRSSSGENSLFGNLLVLIAVLSYSFYTVLSKPLQKISSPLFITTSFIVTTIFIQGSIAMLTVPNISTSVGNLSVASIVSILYVGLLGTAGYFLLYQYAIKKASPITTSMVFYLQPIFTFFWSMFLLGENLAPQYIVGGAIAFTGAYLVTKG